MFISQRSAIFDFNDLDEITLNLSQRKYTFWAKHEEAAKVTPLIKKIEDEFERINNEYTSFNQEQKIITLMFKLLLDIKDITQDENYQETLEIVKAFLQEIHKNIN